MSGPKLLIIGHPEHRRVAFFEAALARHDAPAPTILSYEQCLTQEIDWATYLTPETILRIESPGENPRVMRELLRLGAARFPQEATWPEALDPSLPDPASLERGRLIHPRQRFLGFRAFLEDLQHALHQHPVRLLTNSPAAILTMFDKAATYERFISAGVPCPERLCQHNISGYDELRALMEQQRAHNVFIKLRYSSSASGVIAYMVRGRNESATTSARLVRRGHELAIFNSLNIQRYQDHQDIRDLIDSLATQDLVVERWMPKASIAQKNFDLRVVSINGVARHCVMRSSSSPMTNLHLGNARGDLEQLLNIAGEGALERAFSCAQAAHAAVGPDSLYAGADIMFSPNYREVRAIEINAFGDLIPNVLIDGEDTYGAEVRAIRALTQAW